MKHTILNSSVFLAMILIIGVSCKKEINNRAPVSKSDAVPAQVTNITVVNKKGKSTLHYTVPSDPNLLYVKAVYELKNGPAEVKASYYSDSLTVDGFGDTLEHEIKIYSVSRSEVESAVTVVKVNPLRSPIWDVYQSIAVENAFGGYNLTADNLSNANISLVVLTKNDFNEFEIDRAKTVNTNADFIESKIRGLDTLDYPFGFLVRDRWGNTTDTLYKSIKPFYETIFPKSKFKEFFLPGDASEVGGAALRYAWDGQFYWGNVSFTDPNSGNPGPQTVTFDMGSLGKVSRVWYRPYQEWGGQYFYLATLKRFEIWGSENPSLTGAYDNTWILLGTYELKKPSGLPYGTDDANDQAVAAAGFSLDVDLNAPKVRYMRIRCLENWAGGYNQNISELEVYGDPR